VLREYETTFILQPEITDEGAKALRDRVDGILERNGAVRLLYDDERVRVGRTSGRIEGR
jgi:ribosomal protein S6